MGSDLDDPPSKFFSNLDSRVKKFNISLGLSVVLSFISTPFAIYLLEKKGVDKFLLAGVGVAGLDFLLSKIFFDSSWVLLNLEKPIHAFIEAQIMDLREIPTNLVYFVESPLLVLFTWYGIPLGVGCVCVLGFSLIISILGSNLLNWKFLRKA